MKSYLNEPDSVIEPVVDALSNLKALNLSIIDVKKQSSFTDFMVIATGTSNRHVNAIVEAVVLDAKSRGVSVLGIEGQKAADWVLIDLGDTIVNVMQHAAREFYDLERLWGVGSSKQQEAV